MRITILIISILFSVVCFGQSYSSYITIPEDIPMFYPDRRDTFWPFDTTKTPKVDSMDLKVISMNEFKTYMERIDLAVKKQFDLTEVQKYEQIIRVMNSIYAEADKKRRK